VGVIDYFKKLYQQMRVYSQLPSQQRLFLTLAGVLVKCRHRRSSDWRDMIYGVLGLFPESVRHVLKPSYTESVEEVWLRIAHQILRCSRSFILFSHGGLENDHFLDIPSWVPQWISCEYYYENVELRIAQQDLFDASAGKEFYLGPPQGMILKVQALPVDTVLFWHTPRHDPYDPIDIAFRLDTWLELCLEHGPYQSADADYFRGCTVQEAVLRTGLNDCIPTTEGNEIVRARWSDLLTIRHWLERITDAYNSEDPTDEDFARTLFDNGSETTIYQHLRAAVLDKAFFITKSGYIGLTGHQIDFMDSELPNEASEFKVFVLAGGKHPVILRPVPGKLSTYTVVAEAYVHGIMDGEAVLGLCSITEDDSVIDSPTSDSLLVKAGPRPHRSLSPKWIDILIE
jgi:hypothetical protein